MVPDLRTRVRCLLVRTRLGLCRLGVLLRCLLWWAPTSVFPLEAGPPHQFPQTHYIFEPNLNFTFCVYIERLCDALMTSSLFFTVTTLLMISPPAFSMVTRYSGILPPFMRNRPTSSCGHYKSDCRSSCGGRAATMARASLMAVSSIGTQRDIHM